MSGMESGSLQCMRPSPSNSANAARPLDCWNVRDFIGARGARLWRGVAHDGVGSGQAVAVAVGLTRPVRRGHVHPALTQGLGLLVCFAAEHACVFLAFGRFSVCGVGQGGFPLALDQGD